MMLFAKLAAYCERRSSNRNQGEALTISVEGCTYKTHDWSLGGFRLDGFHRDLRIGDRITGTIRVSRWAPPGDFTAEVMHTGVDRMFGARLIDISSRTFAAMASAAI
jgi:hypothetical protein